MATKPANTEQKKWMSDISEWCENNIQILYGNEWLCKPFQLHHVLGRSAKHNKIAIGHWFILPVPFELHDVSSNHIWNVTHHKHAFTDVFGSQCSLFDKMHLSMEDYGYNMPTLKEYLAIMSTNA